jgi:hypothetical protein
VNALAAPLARASLAIVALLAAASPARGDDPVRAAPSAAADPAARLLPGSDAGEHWDLTADLDGGYRIFARFQIRNGILGDRSAAATGAIVAPDGHVTEFHYAKRKDDWKLGSDGLRLDIASASLDLHPAAPRLAIDSNSHGIKVSVELAQRWSHSLFAEQPSLDLLALEVPAKAKVWLTGMGDPAEIGGTATLTHSWASEAETSLVQRRVEILSRSGDVALYLLDVTTPAGSHHRRLVVERSGSIVTDANDFEIEERPSTTADANGGYPLPGGFVIHTNGCNLRVRTGALLLRSNPLDAVPLAFRLLLETRTQPQRTWSDAAADIEMTGGTEGQPTQLRARGIVAIEYFQPLQH